MSQESFGYSIQCYSSLRALFLAYNVHLQKILCISEVSVRQNHGKTSCSFVLSTSSGVLFGFANNLDDGLQNNQVWRQGSLRFAYQPKSAKENRLWCGNSTIKNIRKRWFASQIPEQILELNLGNVKRITMWSFPKKSG